MKAMQTAALWCIWLILAAISINLAYIAKALQILAGLK